MTYYNLTNATNTGITNIAKVANEVTGGLFGVSILIVIFMATFIFSLSKGPANALGYSSFTTLLATILFIVTGLAQPGILTISIIVVCLAGGLLFLKGSNM